MHEDLRAAVAADMPRLQGTLADLVRHPSVSAPGYDPSDVRETANHIVGLLDQAGFSNTQLLDPGFGNPVVFGEIPAPEGAPTLLLYAHYDVQPPGPKEEWDTDPFEPEVIDGRLYGRGAADNKAGVVMHLGAVGAHKGRPPVGVKAFFEGEEEAGSGNLEAILDKYADLIAPDVIVIGDGGVFAVGVPELVASLRGLAAVKLELTALEGAVHSGQSGGVVPDALIALSRLLASLHDDDGNVAVKGLFSAETDLEMSEEQARREARATEGLATFGTGTAASRLWTKPAIAVVAIDAPPTDHAINQLVPSARAKVSMRIPPGQDADEALELLKTHLVEHAPWGTKVSFLREEKGDAAVLDTENSVATAWNEAFLEAFGIEAKKIGAGGSIPFISTFSERYPDAPILMVGCGDPTSNIHAPNESQDLSDVEKATLSEAIAFRLLANH